MWTRISLKNRIYILLAAIFLVTFSGAAVMVWYSYSIEGVLTAITDENLVAFCDVDRKHSAENMKNWRTNQPFFDDFRVMLEKEASRLDGVMVGTPDHTHAPAAAMAAPATSLVAPVI